jgi:hypothetical protein
MATSAERTCVVLLLAYLAWVPMPFGSNVDAAFLPLILPPMLLCAITAWLRFREASLPYVTLAYRIWTAGAVAFLVVVAFQLVPMPRFLLAIVSPKSSEIWTSADHLALLAGVSTSSLHPISIHPDATWREILRFLALFAAMQSAAMLITTNTRRIAFAVAIIVTALFEILYGVREAALRRYAIWGWVNKLVLNRVTGTYVNPNHFAHFVALALPFTVFFVALAWRNAGAATMPLRRRIVLLFEKSLALFSAGILAFLGCVAGILLAQSRGALAATLAGFAAITVVIARRERHPEIVARQRHRYRARNTAATILSIIVLLSIVVSLIAFLGYERTVARFEPATPGERSTLVGRVTGFKSAVGVWRRFPIFGSGLGTFGDVVSLVQKDDLEHIYQHAHDDYVEILATTGIVGFTVAMLSLFGGTFALAVNVMRRPRQSGSWRRRAFEIAGLWSLFIAMAHAFFDFNSFIPANAATLAAIIGACVSYRVRMDSRERSEPSAVPGFA